MNLILMPIAMTCVIASSSAARADEPDPQKVLNEAQALNRQGKYEESLQKHLWYHENAIRLSPSQTGVRLSFALSDWTDLGEKYPKAREALVAVRDKDVAAFAEGRGTFPLFMDVSSINGYLKEPARTVDLFKAIEEKDPELAGQGFNVAERVLAARGDYETCSKYIPDPAARVRRSEEMLDMNAKRADAPPSLRDYAERTFVEENCRLIEILVGADRKPEAENVRTLALAVRDDPAIREAVAKAVDRKAAQAKAITLGGSPPVVVRTAPEAGSQDVDPATAEVRVTFSKTMQDGNWSWCIASPESFPNTPGKPRYAEDRRTCVLPVKLEPGKTYAIWVNSDKFRNFKDDKGTSAVPFLLVFKTKD